MIALQVILSGLLLGGIYALMGMGLSLIFGILKIANFAQGEFYTIGAYLCFLCISMGLNPFLAIIVSALGAFILGSIIEKVCIASLRKMGGREWLLDAFVLTLGLSIILQNIFLIIFGAEYRGIPYLWPGTISFLGVHLTVERAIILTLITVAGIIFWFFIQKTDVGKATRAVAQNAQSAKALGINVEFIYTLTFGLGAVLSGIAGAFLLPIVTVYPTAGYLPLLKGFTVVILGGLGSIKGAVIGGVLLGIIEAFATFLFGAGWQYVISLVMVILVLIIKPEGLFRV